MADDPKKVIEGEVLDVQAQQHELEELQTSLSQNKQFTRFMELSKAVGVKMAEVRAHIEELMIPAYKEGKIDKKIEGEWGFVTVTEGTDIKVDLKELSPKFIKKVADTTKIRKTLELEDKPIKGVTSTKKYGIMLKLKETV